MAIWQSQEAKAKFSELMRMAKNSPQIITVRDVEEAVLVSKQYFDNITKSELSLVKFMKNSPLYGIEVDLERDTSLSRDIKL